MSSYSMFLDGQAMGPETQKAYKAIQEKKNQPAIPAVAPATTQNYYHAPQVDYYSQLMAAIEAQAKKRREANIAAIDNQLRQQLSAYDQQAADLEPIYQGYRNQSEVERYKAQKSLREALANRGALDSGAGRQETLDLQNNYGNNLNKINLQYQSELDAINRAKQQLRSEAEYQKIQAANDVDNVGLEAQISALSQLLANQQSASRSAASTAAAAQTQSQIGNSAVSDGGSAFDSLNNMFLRGTNGTKSDSVKALYLREAYNDGTLTAEDMELLMKQYGLGKYKDVD